MYFSTQTLQTKIYNLKPQHLIIVNLESRKLLSNINKHGKIFYHICMRTGYVVG